RIDVSSPAMDGLDDKTLGNGSTATEATPAAHGLVSGVSPTAHAPASAAAAICQAGRPVGAPVVRQNLKRPRRNADSDIGVGGFAVLVIGTLRGGAGAGDVPAKV